MDEVIEEHTTNLVYHKTGKLLEQSMAFRENSALENIGRQCGQEQVGAKLCVCQGCQFG